ncbi:hypothetical protein [Nocardioides currus]|uniref:hypothetical protein n=1 Tax=Nocardioides currus TaxID=2133958 RepID=UPI001FAEB726|nr:hypothetical protein [Nocardioides currus]
MRADAGRAWLSGTVDRMLTGGCAGVAAVHGAPADHAERLMDDRVSSGGVALVRACDWRRGMGTSLRAGLRGWPVPPTKRLSSISSICPT